MMNDHYRMTLDEVVKFYYKGSTTEQEYKKLKYTKGFDKASEFELNYVNSLIAGQKLALEMFVIPKWYSDNFETGGLLDSYDNGRKNKRLIGLCNLVFG